MKIKWAICYTARLDAEAGHEHLVMWFTGMKHHNGQDPIFAHRSTNAHLYDNKIHAETQLKLFMVHYNKNPLSQTMFVAPVLEEK